MISLLPMLIFFASQVGTPGPANMALLATGARFGLRRALPFVAGVCCWQTVDHLAHRLWSDGGAERVSIGVYSAEIRICGVYYFSGVEGCESTVKYRWGGRHCPWVCGGADRASIEPQGLGDDHGGVHQFCGFGHAHSAGNGRDRCLPFRVPSCSASLVVLGRGSFGSHSGGQTCRAVFDVGARRADSFECSFRFVSRR